MLRRKEKVSKDKIMKGKKTWVPFVAGMAFVLLAMPNYIYAAGQEYLQPLNVGKMIVLAIVEVVGLYNLAIGIMDLSDIIKNKQQNGLRDAISTLAAGGICVAAPIIIAAMTS